MAVKPKVQLIAVAKDEAPYLADFIHHHLYFGFAGIKIFINRTTDRSLEVMKAIAGAAPAVSYDTCDWIDWAAGPRHERPTSIQRLAYAMALDQHLKAPSEITHVMFLDIDEFWFPVDFITLVADWAASVGSFDLLSAHWFCKFGERAAFLPPFADGVVEGSVRKQVKTLLTLGTRCDIREVRCHTPALVPVDAVIHKGAAGEDFLPRCGQASGAAPQAGQTAYVLHRMMRSKPEYKALMRRGNPEDRQKPKDNRDPFFIQQNPPDNLLLNAAALQAYHDSRNGFIIRCGLTELLSLAQKELI